MIYLILAILFNSILTIIFRLFPKYRIDNLSAIVWNYIACFITGVVVSGGAVLNVYPPGESWFESAILLGIFFIIGFNIVAATVQTFGIGITAIMQKMSLIFVVLYAVIFIGEGASVLKIIGLVCALSSVVLINWPESGAKARRTGYLILLPTATLLLSGIIDSAFLHISHKGIAHAGDINFVAYLFLFAGLIGFVILGIRIVYTRKWPHLRDFVAGTILGIPNFFAVYFIMRMLDIGWEGSIVFPINNIGILIVSVCAGLIFFKEKLNLPKATGFALSVLSIIILAYTQFN
jgi:drug/metabolite transporter (DMT)-like permease